MVSVFCVDSTFCCDAQKMVSGQLLALSAMIALELPHINVLTKGDLLPEKDIEAILNLQSASELWSIEQDRTSLFADRRTMSSVMIEDFDEEALLARAKEEAVKKAKGIEEVEDEEKKAERQRQLKLERRRRQRHRMTESICSLLDDYTMVSFVPLNVNDEESIDHVLMTVDHAVQYGEDLEVRGADGDDENFVNPNDGWGDVGGNNNDD